MLGVHGYDVIVLRWHDDDDEKKNVKFDLIFIPLYYDDDKMKLEIGI